MIREICVEFGLDPGSLQIAPLGSGLINSTWRIDTPSQRYILQKINRQVFKRPDWIAENIRNVSDFLSSHFPGYYLPAPMRTLSGKDLFRGSDGEFYRMFPFVEGSVTLESVSSSQQAYEAAKKFGEFTRLMSQFDASVLHITLPDFHNLALRYDQFVRSLDTGNPGRVARSANLVDFIRANEPIVERYRDILSNAAFRLRVTHHDTKISNILFDKENHGICIIDLDTLMPGYFISDVGDMFRTYLSPVTEEEKDFSGIHIRESYFKAIHDGYLGEMKNILSKQEKDHFIYSGKFMIYMQMIRFLTDYFLGDRYYTVRYEDQNFVRAGNQAVLLEKLIEAEPRLARLMQDAPL